MVKEQADMESQDLIRQRLSTTQDQIEEKLRGAGGGALQGGFELLVDQYQRRERQREVLKDIKNALWRLENGKFGICEDCGREIPEDRLEACLVPFYLKKEEGGLDQIDAAFHLRRCVFCQENYEKRFNRNNGRFPKRFPTRSLRKRGAY